MEHLQDWLIVLCKALHIPVILGLHIGYKDNRWCDMSDMQEIGDNLPHVFM